jgi:hypothetical protein
MRTHSLVVPLLAVAALAAAVISGGKTWPLVAAQALLGAAWLFARQLRSGSGPVLFWVIPAGMIVVFGMAAVPSSADESAYRFQSRIFGAGQLAAPAPTGNTLVNYKHKNEFFLVHTIQRDGKWFVQYAPGWPAVLALPEKLGIGKYANPMLAVLLLWITWRVAAHLDGAETARRALFFMVLSPMFLLNFSGYYSHGLTAVLLAATVWATITDSSASLRNPALALAMLIMLGLARPLSGLVCGIPIVAMLLWNRRKRPAPAAICALIVVLALGLTVGTQACYNYLQAGDPWKSLYSVYRGDVRLGFVRFTPGALWENLLTFTLRSLVKTAASMFAFPLLLWAAWSAVRSWRPEYILLGSMAVLAPIAYTVVSEQSDTIVGERYYIEVLFALVILAAAGMRESVPRWLMVCSILAAGASTFWLGKLQLERRNPFASMEALAVLRTEPEEVVFLGAHPLFEPTDTNLNYPDWPYARPLWMPDPGLARRTALACGLGRRQWTLVTPPTENIPAAISAPVAAHCAEP